MSLALAGFTGLGFYVGRSLDRTQSGVEIDVPPTTTFLFRGLFGRSHVGVRGDVRRTASGSGFAHSIQLTRSPYVAPREESAFWSPTNQSIGFFADGKLKRIDVNGGSPQTLANATVASGGSVEPEWRHRVQPRPGRSLARLFNAVGRRCLSHSWSHQSHSQPAILLPITATSFCLSKATQRNQRCAFGSLESPGNPPPVCGRRCQPFHVAGSDCFLIQEGTLFARRLDMRWLEPTGEPVPVARRVAAVWPPGAGVVAYRTTPRAPGVALDLGWTGRADRSRRPGRLAMR